MFVILKLIFQRHFKDGLSKCLNSSILKHCIEETIENPEKCVKVGQNTFINRNMILLLVTERWWW